jgi:hypothetical protein
MALAFTSAEKAMVNIRTAQTPIASVKILFLIRSSCVLSGGVSMAADGYGAMAHKRIFPDRLQATKALEKVQLGDF